MVPEAAVGAGPAGCGQERPWVLVPQGFVFRAGFGFLPARGTSVIHMFASRNNKCGQVKPLPGMLKASATR